MNSSIKLFESKLYQSLILLLGLTLLYVYNNVCAFAYRNLKVYGYYNAASSSSSSRENKFKDLIIGFQSLLFWRTLNFCINTNKIMFFVYVLPPNTEVGLFLSPNAIVNFRRQLDSNFCISF